MDNKILITGGSGFLGKEVIQYFKSQNIPFLTIGRGRDNTIVADLKEEIPDLKNYKIDTVLHIAGKAHSIPKTAAEQKEFYDVNLHGTQKLLNGLKDNTPRNFIFISTVAVYGLEKGINITEDYPLEGKTPYAKSKIEAEREVIKFGSDYGVNVSVLRLPLVVGKNPIGNLGSIIKGIKKGYYFRIGNGEAKRSLVAASDIGPLVIKLDGKSGIYNVTDSSNSTIKDIDIYISGIYNKKIKTLPLAFLKYISKIGDIIPFFPLNSYKFDKLTSSLTFSNDKLLSELDWEPSYSLDNLK